MLMDQNGLRTIDHLTKKLNQMEVLEKEEEEVTVVDGAVQDSV